MELTGSTFILRPYAETDAEALVEAANNINVWRNLGHAFPHPYTLDIAHAWIAECASAPENDLRLTIDVAGAAIGGVGLHPRHACSTYTYELGYWLGEPYWGRGIMTEAVGLVTAHGFDRVRAERIEAKVFDWNLGSARVLEKNAFELEGRMRRAAHKDGRWGDLLVYGRLR